jgi:hypothetical protein
MHNQRAETARERLTIDEQGWLIVEVQTSAKRSHFKNQQSALSNRQSMLSSVHPA